MPAGDLACRSIVGVAPRLYLPGRGLVGLVGLLAWVGCRGTVKLIAMGPVAKAVGVIQKLRHGLCPS